MSAKKDSTERQQISTYADVKYGWSLMYIGEFLQVEILLK